MNIQEEIRKLAYDFYEKSGMIPGRDIENWVKAERIIKARYSEGRTAEKIAPAPKPAKTPLPKAKAAVSEPQPVETKKAGAKKAEAKKTETRKSSRSAK